MLAIAAWLGMFFAFVAPAPAPAADPVPDAKQLLHMARMSQGAKEWKLLGKLRLGRVNHPFRLTLEKAAIRYEFLDNGDTITLKLGEKSSTLEERRGGKTGKVTAARFDEQVRGTDIRYEDLSMRFLYWNDAKVLGDELKKARSCWKVEVRPPSKGESQYSRVLLWIAKEDGAIMFMEAYDANDKWARRFTVNEVMREDGFWLLKKMRVESADGRITDSQQTYLQIDEVEK